MEADQSVRNLARIIAGGLLCALAPMVAFAQVKEYDLKALESSAGQKMESLERGLFKSEGLPASDDSLLDPDEALFEAHSIGSATRTSPAPAFPDAYPSVGSILRSDGLWQPPNEQEDILRKNLEDSMNNPLTGDPFSKSYGSLAPGQSLLILPTDSKRDAYTLPPKKNLSPYKNKPLAAETLNSNQTRLNQSMLPESRDSLSSSKILLDRKNQGDALERTDIEEESARKQSRYRLHDGGSGSKPRVSSTRLKSQTLSSFSTATTSGVGPSRKSASQSFTKTSIAKEEKPLSRRFHTGRPGDSPRPDYSYQYQGNRRYSVGETEYSTGGAYQSLPYYRRR